MDTIKVKNLDDLTNALNSKSAVNIEVNNVIVCSNAITLPEGFNLTGAVKTTSFLIFNNSDGVAITKNNSI